MTAGNRPSHRPLPRDMGGSITLPEGTGPIRRMVPCERFLEIYKVDTTFRLETPENIDPDRTNPNAPFVAVVAAGVGTSNLVVARVLLQSSDILDAAMLSGSVDKLAVISVLHDTKEALLVCQRVSDRINEEVLAAEAIWAKQVDDDPRPRRVIASLPQVPDLDARATEYLINAKRAIRSICQLVPLFLKVDRTDTDFDHLLPRLSALVGDSAPITQFVRDNADLARYLTELRNYQEHAKRDKSTRIENVRIGPDGNPMVPMWYITGSQPRPLHAEMRIGVAALVEMAELMLIHLVDERLDTRWPFVIVDHAESDIDPELPIRYRLTVDASKLGLPPAARAV